MDQFGDAIQYESKEKRSIDDCHASTQAYIDFMRSRCVELDRDVSFCY